MVDIETNVIHCGDNLEVMRGMPDESVDLIYADPPFRSNATYEQTWGSANELSSFEDRWSGGIYHYIGWMKERMQECHRLLKPTGSMYLHCDWHAGHYLKVMMDDVFDIDNFQNEIVWCYNSPVNSKKRFCRKHDTIFFYSKSGKWTFNSDDVRVPYGAWAKGKKSYKTTSFGLEKPVEVQLNEKGRLCPDYWDIPMIGSSSNERLGYKTQKPEKLLDRIINASSNKGDIVLDPFAGCGTSTAVAQMLSRKWIGIDQETEACAKIAIRLRVPFVDIIGMPLSTFSIDKMLSHQFQQWVCRRMSARNDNLHPENPPDGYNGVDAVVMSQDLDTTGYDNAPIMILKEEDVGANRVKEFFATMHGDGNDIGFIVALSFEDYAFEIAAKYKNEGHADIKLVNAKDIAIDGYFK